jgi:hypothetical protein
VEENAFPARLEKPSRNRVVEKTFTSRRKKMIKSCIAAMGTLTVLSAPAFADYYIVHGPDRHCRVVERVPEGGSFVRVGPLHFGTREEAEGQVRVVCRDNGYYREEARRGEMREDYREERR